VVKIDSAMLYRTYIPGPPLCRFVEWLWLYEGDNLPHRKERVLPDGAMQLIVNLREDRLRAFDREDHGECRSFCGSLVSGAHSEFVVIDTACLGEVMGVHFRPGGAFPFFRSPGNELRDAHVSLDALWGSRAAGLRDRLLEAKTAEDRFRILEQALLAQAARPLAGDPAVAFALRELQYAPHTRTISEIGRQIGLSPRRFIEAFSEEVGLTPKLFCRIRRFQQVLRLMRSGRRIDWTDIALSCGYFDQPHFIHDFRSFSGINPTAYLAHCGEHANHVPILD